jgi:hypothetical protein
LFRRIDGTESPRISALFLFRFGGLCGSLISLELSELVGLVGLEIAYGDLFLLKIVVVNLGGLLYGSFLIVLLLGGLIGSGLFRCSNANKRPGSPSTKTCPDKRAEAGEYHCPNNGTYPRANPDFFYLATHWTLAHMTLSTPFGPNFLNSASKLNPRNSIVLAHFPPT